MGKGLPALCRAPGPIQGPYGCLIEHTALLIELTAPSVGPFPLLQRRGVCSTPALVDLVAGEGGGGGGGLRVRRRELLKPSRKRVPFCWQTQARNVNWGQPEVSVFTGPAGFTRTECTHTHRQYTYCIYTVNSPDCLQ